MKPDEGSGSPGTGVADVCQPLCGCWELNLCPLKVQSVFLTFRQPSLYPSTHVLSNLTWFSAHMCSAWTYSLMKSPVKVNFNTVFITSATAAGKRICFWVEREEMVCA